MTLDLDEKGVLRKQRWHSCHLPMFRAVKLDYSLPSVRKEGGFMIIIEE
jgi:hypothetical protein